MKRTETSYLGWLDRMPPIMCRMIARKTEGGRIVPITLQEIAAATGMKLGSVERLAKRFTWEGVPIERIDSFRAACGIFPANERRQRAYFKRTYQNSSVPLRHLYEGRIHKKAIQRLLNPSAR